MAGDSGKTASGQQAEPIVELSRNILRTEYLHAGGGKFHSKGMAPHHWGTGMTAPGERLDSDGEGGKVERATIETPKVSAPGALVHMTAGSFSGLGRLQKSKLPQTGRTSKAEM